MDPRLEALGFPQVREPAPGEHEGVLQRVLGETGVAQDPLSHRVERVADLVHQDGERLTIAPTGLLDEVSIHHRPPVCRTQWRGLPTMTGGWWPNVQSVPTISLRRSSRTTSRQRPRASWPSRRWTPIRRNPTRSWRARLRSFSARTPASSVQ